MELEVNIPSVGESVKEATLAEWLKQDGDRVEKDEALFTIETDKVTLEVAAPAAGVLHIRIQEGEQAAIGAVAAVIETDDDGAAPKREEPAAEEDDPPAKEKTAADAPEKPPAKKKSQGTGAPKPSSRTLSPAVRRLVEEHGLAPDRIPATGPRGNLTKADVLRFLAEDREPAGDAPQAAPACTDAPHKTETRKPMTPIRKRIAERLVAAKQQTAMLTTFNEIDMSAVMDLRARYKESFKKKHDVALGFMSFFIKACVEALTDFPEINAFIDGEEIVYHPYVHMGIAIGAKRGLVVPVIRNAEEKSFAELEKAILDFAEKANNNRLAISDLEGGTFTISNGGVYGSLLSTPILNMPQSGILGMHKIEKRPVVVDDEIVVRPMMYVALSYDHRIVDGKEAVRFLKQVKEGLEEPARMLMEV